MTHDATTQTHTAAHPAGRIVLGRTGLVVSRICVGTGAWGPGSVAHGPVDADDTAATAALVFRGPLNFLDTSNNYGDGDSERRLGAAIRRHGGLPSGFVVQTKLDRDPHTDSFGGARMRRSFEESLQRLGLDRVPLLYLHDPEVMGFDGAMAAGGPVDALVALRDEGLVDHIGVAGGPVPMLRSFVATDLFDAVITHNRYSLVDRSADALLTEAAERGVGVLNAAVYGGGILSRWPRVTDRYHYRPARRELLAAVDAIGALCDRHGIPLIAAALQFSMRDPRVHATICGMVSPEQLTETLRWADLPIPAEFWVELEPLVPPRSSWINDQ
ncbi:aldo/keto reductase [Nakamurella deserti]|uniref:aldo/keto reductase n=1 Tax=Nakamurella deserti TaxID=2164074 RepID=UPI000DBE0D87|nr:aldo/keto reductase [Nakamurella deserti]